MTESKAMPRVKQDLSMSSDKDSDRNRIDAIHVPSTSHPPPPSLPKHPPPLPSPSQTPPIEKRKTRKGSNIAQRLRPTGNASTAEATKQYTPIVHLNMETLPMEFTVAYMSRI